MVAPNNCSAARNNPDNPKRRNDTPDRRLIERILGARAGIQKLDLQANKARNSFLAQHVTNGFSLTRASPATWDAFITQPFWSINPKQRPKASDQDDAVKFVLRIAFEGVAHGTKRANEVWQAVRYLIKSRLSETDVVNRIEAGLDIKGIGRKVAEQNRTAGATTAPKAKNARMKTSNDARGSETTVSKGAVAKQGQAPTRASNASVKREHAVQATSAVLTFPQGFEGLEKLLEKKRSVRIEVSKLGGGGTDITVKLHKMKRTKKAPKSRSPAAN